MGAVEDVDDAKCLLLPAAQTSDKSDLPTMAYPHQPRSSTLFKAYVIASMTCLWTAYTLTVRYTRSTVPPDKMYSATTVVLSAEAVKLVITFLMLFRDLKGDFGDFQATLSKHYFGAPRELAKMSVPSIAYALQNNLDFVGLSNLDAGLYQVTTQLKVVSTALFMMAFLGRKFSGTRWAAIVLLMLGVAAVQMNNVSPSSAGKEGVENYVIGISAVLATCVTAGFAGVYFEKMLKDGGSTPFWVRNMQMYSCGVGSAALACMMESDDIAVRGFFHGYDEKVFAIVGFLSLGGVYISLVMKHLDNLHKSFASAFSIVIVVVVSLFIFPDVFIGAYFVLGAFLVISAILLYNSVPE